MSSANATLSTLHAIIAVSAVIVVVLFCTCAVLSIVRWVPAESGFPVNVSALNTP